MVHLFYICINRFGAAEQAISALFVLHLRPDLCAAAIIRTLAERLQAGMITDLAEGGVNIAKTNMTTMMLSRFFFAIGHVSLKMLVHLERVESELKMIRGSKEKQRDEAACKSKKDDASDAKASGKSISGHSKNMAIADVAGSGSGAELPSEKATPTRMVEDVCKVLYNESRGSGVELPSEKATPTRMVEDVCKVMYNESSVYLLYFVIVYP